MPLWLPFTIQFLAALACIPIARLLARAAKPVWLAALLVSLLLLCIFPLIRVFPTVPIDLLGPRTVSLIEFTALFIPAVAFFTIAAEHIPRPSDRRAMYGFVAFCLLYFIRAGWWMLATPPTLGPTVVDRGICMQSTGYTCVSASLVTMLHARSIDTTESEMAALTHTERNSGATDSRALWALETKLADTSLRPRYHSLDLRGLIAATKPCLVQIDWSYFISHMVPVMSADESTVTIGDPLSGPKTMPTSEFLAKWKGQAITIEEAVSLHSPQ